MLQEAMSTIEMPRFTRRYPALTDSVLRQMLEYTREFELELQKKQAEQEKKRQEKQKQQPQEPQDTQPAGEAEEGDEAAEGGQQEPDGAQENPEGGEGSLQVRGGLQPPCCFHMPHKRHHSSNDAYTVGVF